METRENIEELNFSNSCFLAKSLYMTELMRFQPFARQVYLTSKPLSSIMTIFFSETSRKVA